MSPAAFTKARTLYWPCPCSCMIDWFLHCLMVLFYMHKLEKLNCRVIATISWKVDIEGHWPNCGFHHICVGVLKSSRCTVSRCRKSEPQGSKVYMWAMYYTEVFMFLYLLWPSLSSQCNHLILSVFHKYIKMTDTGYKMELKKKEESSDVQRFSAELQHQLKWRWLSSCSAIAYSFLFRGLTISSYWWYNPYVMTLYYWFSVILKLSIYWKHSFSIFSPIRKLRQQPWHVQITCELL